MAETHLTLQPPLKSAFGFVYAGGEALMRQS